MKVILGLFQAKVGQLSLYTLPNALLWAYISYHYVKPRPIEAQSSDSDELYRP